MLIGERDLRNEIAVLKATVEMRETRMLASLVGGVPVWDRPIVNGKDPVGGSFIFAPLAAAETISFMVNPLVRVKALATKRFLVGAVDSGAMVLDASGNLILTFTVPRAIVAGPLAVTIPAAEFETLAGIANAAQIITVTFVAVV